MIRLLRQWEEKCFRLVDTLVPKYAPTLRKRARLVRYLISGGTAAVLDLGLLYFFTDILLIHYLTSAILAFVLTFFVSFMLQKFWTFQDDSTERVHTQAFFYFLMAFINLGLNTVLMYLFVDVGKFWYLGSQFLASGLLAFESFFVSRLFIFKKGAVASTTTNPTL